MYFNNIEKYLNLKDKTPSFAHLSNLILIRLHIYHKFYQIKNTT